LIPLVTARLSERSESKGEMSEWLKERLEIALAVCDGVLRISITVAKLSQRVSARPRTNLMLIRGL
jgi:hypothetical protein